MVLQCHLGWQVSKYRVGIFGKKIPVLVKVALRRLKKGAGVPGDGRSRKATVRRQKEAKPMNFILR